MSLPLSSGAIISHFQIEREVGRGGMGIVYHARDLSLSRPVALKVLAPYAGRDGKMLARFRREAEAAAQLKHPNLATVFEFGTHEDQPYIAAEWVEGRNLREVLEHEGILPLPRALRLFNQIAAALDYAHAHGVVHRDVKPANILITPAEQAILVDFGLAWTTGAASLTDSGTVMGTIRYISPEQLRNEPIDGRTDQYSLAIALYEMLAGRSPFETDETVALMKMHLFEPPPPITDFNPNLPKGLNSVFEKALAKVPAERFATMAEFTHHFRGQLILPEEAKGQTRIMPARALPGEALDKTEVTPPTPETPFDPAETAPPAAAPQELSPSPKGAGLTKPPQFHPRWLIPAVIVSAFLLLALFASLLQANRQLPPFTPDAPTETSPTASPTITPTVPASIIWPVEGGAWPMPGGNSAFTHFVPEGLTPYYPLPRWLRALPAETGLGLSVGNGMVAFDIQTGSTSSLFLREWSVGLSLLSLPLTTTLTSAPIIYANPETPMVLGGLGDGSLAGIQLNSSGSVWIQKPAAMRGTVYGLTMGADSALYAVTDTGWLHALEPTQGTLFWSLDLRAYGTFHYPPAVTSLGTFLVSDNQTLSAILPSTQTLTVTWTAETLGIPTTPPMVIESLDLVLIGTQQGWVHGFTASNGAWALPLLVNSPVYPIAGMATDGARIYAATGNGVLYAWDTAGTLLWAVETGAPTSAAPLTDGTYVLLANQAGEVRFYNAADGSEIVDWRLNLGEPILHSPAVAGGWLYVRGAANLYAFGP
ncbi:MAG: hypothetical protein Fur0022_44950 [Anaerolineales bacterium]